ncbi:MAG: ECF transporter S component [Erysipelotrichaceae bacterium]|nr:ECF transporter S component [Erysipelotrichaceae bacterium]
MHSKTRRFAYLTVFVTMEILFAVVPFLGFIPLGVINATTMHLPVILAGILLGPKEGALLGFIFGLSSFLKATFQPGLSSFLFTPFYGAGNASSLLIAFVPRILIGVVSGVLYRVLKDKINDVAALGIASFSGAFINTALVMGMAFLFFKDAYAQYLGIAPAAVGGVILSVVFTNGIAEALVAVVVGIVIGKLGQRMIKGI